jgi:hypothetical protein
MKGAVAKAKELAKETLNAVIPQQFCNPANPEFHRKTKIGLPLRRRPPFRPLFGDEKLWIDLSLSVTIEVA